MRKTVSGILLTLLLISMFTLAFDIKSASAQAATVTINSDGSVSPSSAPISSVDNVTYTLTGDVNYPTYNGIIVERNNIVFDGDGYTVKGNYGGTGLNLTDISNVTIKSIRVQNFENGIYLSGSNNNVISGNYITDYSNGVYLYSSSNNTVSGNNAIENDEYGILLESSSNNTVSGNNATNNKYGIVLYSSSNNNSVSGNNATANYDSMILESSSNNTVSGNDVTANYEGIVLYSSSNNNSVSGNNATANVHDGFVLESSSNNTVIVNDVTANYDGIVLYSSSNNNTVSWNNATANKSVGIYLDYSSNNNTVSENTATTNGQYGIYLNSSSNNTIYHDNFVNNSLQVGSVNSVNTWDNGYPSGGNYWSDYNGTDLYSGSFQNVTGSDGIGDTPYVIDANNTDHYPLMGSYSTSVLSVTISPSSGTLYVGQSQLFTSTVSVGMPPYSYQWYLDDTPVSGATSVNWVFTPTSSGSYTVYVKVNETVGLEARSGTALVGVSTGIHDVSITKVTPSKTVVGQGYWINITATVQNQGNFTETFNLTVYANATFAASQNVTLSSGNSTSITFAWDTTGFAYGNYTMNVYARLVPGETNTANNNDTDGLTVVTIPGDLNGDFTVGLSDLVILAKAYGSTPGDSWWNPNADIDGNGVVGLSDLVLLAQHYGQHYP